MLLEHRCDLSVGRPDGFGGVGGHEAVALGREFLVQRFDAGLGQSVGVGLALVSHQIKARRDDDGRRQPRQIRSKQRRNVRVLFERTALEIVGSRPLELRFGEDVPFTEFLHGRMGEGVVDHRVHHHLGLR